MGRRGSNGEGRSTHYQPDYTLLSAHLTEIVKLAMNRSPPLSLSIKGLYTGSTLMQ